MIEVNGTLCSELGHSCNRWNRLYYAVSL